MSRRMSWLLCVVAAGATCVVGNSAGGDILESAGQATANSSATGVTNPSFDASPHSESPAAAGADSPAWADSPEWLVDDFDEKPSRFGPDPGEPRGTLFQWSYGTSFRGGPPLDGPLETDRPDFTEATTTVGRGVLQVEAGYTYTYDEAGDTSVRTQSFGEPLFRYGIFADWLEFRLAVFPTDERTVTPGSRSRTRGTEDLFLGFKIALTPQEGILPEMAIIPQATVPTGSNAFSDDEMLPGVNWVYAWEINDRLSTAGSTQVNRARDGETRGTFYEFAQSWTVAYALTERVGAYTEWFATIPSAADTDRTQHNINGGFTYLLNDDVQFDIRAGKGLSGAADDWFTGAGVSIRFR